jgi:hypothetical protein
LKRKYTIVLMVMLILLFLYHGCEWPEDNRQPGAVWIDPKIKYVTNQDIFFLDVRMNSGTQRLAAFGIIIDYNTTVLDINTAVGYSGVEVGSDGIPPVAVNLDELSGSLIISGFDVAGNEPGSDLHILRLNFSATAVGSSTIEVTVDNLVDVNSVDIGTPNGIGGVVNVTAR